MNSIIYRDRGLHLIRKTFSSHKLTISVGVSTFLAWALVVSLLYGYNLSYKNGMLETKIQNLTDAKVSEPVGEYWTA